MMSLLLTMEGFALRSSYAHLAWDVGALGCEGLSVGGRVIPTSGTGEIIERMAPGISPLICGSLSDFASLYLSPCPLSLSFTLSLLGLFSSQGRAG